MTDTTDIEALVAELHEGPRTGRAAWKKMDAAADALERQQAVVEAAWETTAWCLSRAGDRDQTKCRACLENLRNKLAALDAQPEGEG